MCDKDTQDVANTGINKFWTYFYTIVNISTLPWQSTHPWSDKWSWFLFPTYHAQTYYWYNFLFQWQAYDRTLRWVVRFCLNCSWRWRYVFFVAVCTWDNRLSSACHNSMLGTHVQRSTSDTWVLFVYSNLIMISYWT